MTSDRPQDDLQRRVFDVDYTRLCLPDGGELFLTRYGEPLREALLPARWYDERRYSQDGRRLEGGTGAVYHLAVPHERLGEVRLVIKFSRFARDVPLSVSSEFLAWVPQRDLDGARFNGPFEEFGELMRLRRNSGTVASSGSNTPAGPRPRMLTKRPLAIYVPSEHVPLWRSGRTAGAFDPCRRLQDEDQAQYPPERRVVLDIHRRYVLLFGWVKGLDGVQMLQQGLLDEADLRRITLRSVDELSALGFRMLDVKPRHLILRRRPDGSLLTRHGEFVYALIDFELLLPTAGAKA